MLSSISSYFLRVYVSILEVLVGSQVSGCYTKVRVQLLPIYTFFISTLFIMAYCGADRV